MFRLLLAISIASVSTVAHADDKLELGSTVVANREGSGVTLNGATWLGRFGLALEGGHQQTGSASWLAIGARVSPFARPVSVCRDCVTLRPWFEVGGAREMWMLEGVDQPYWRTTTRAGVGLDLLGSHDLGATIWFRVQHANDRPTVMSPFGEVGQPYDTSLVVGAGVFFGAL
jgi:hypothetical protein